MHHGRIVKRTGDGSIVEFRSVVDAVRCAIEVQNAMVERNAGVPEDRRIEFRIGIHLGDVVEESDGDLMGDGVNIAARLEGIAAPGAICLSERGLLAGQGAARSRRHRSRPDPTQEHRRAGAGLFARGRRPPARGQNRRRRRGEQASDAGPRPAGVAASLVVIAAALVVALLAAGAYAWRRAIAPRCLALRRTTSRPPRVSRSSSCRSRI